MTKRILANGSRVNKNNTWLNVSTIDFRNACLSKTWKRKMLQIANTFEWQGDK